MTKLCTIVIPIFNEAKSLQVLLERINELQNRQFSFLIVDNGSTESNVHEVLTGSTQSGWTYVKAKANQGFGGGIVYGINYCTTEFIGWMPGNLKVDPREVIETFSKIDLEQFDLIKAKRVERKSLPRIKTWIVGLTQSIILRCNMFDSGGTPTICRRSFILGLEELPNNYIFESYVLYQARLLNHRVIRPRVAYGSRKFGTSHWQRGFASELRLTFEILRASLTW